MSVPKEFNKPNQPQVNVDGPQAKQFCGAQEKRLPTPIEWEYVASQGGTKTYSTKSSLFANGF